MANTYPDADDDMYRNWAPLSGPNVGVEQTGGLYPQQDPNPSPREPEGRYLGFLLGTYMSNLTLQ